MISRLQTCTPICYIIVMPRYRVCLCALACFLASMLVTFADPAESDEHLVDTARRLFASDGQASTQTFREFFENAEAGKTTNLNSMDPGKEDPASSKDWSINRNIPAAWIQWLCTDRKASAKVGAQLELDYARIAGDLDLTGAKIPFSLVFSKCAFTGRIVLNKATIQGLTLQSTFIEGVDATSLSVKQNLWFSDGCSANRTVWLRNVSIDGMMMCDGARFHRTPWDGK